MQSKLNLNNSRQHFFYQMLTIILESDDEFAFDSSWVKTMTGLESGEKRLPHTETLCFLLGKSSQSRALCLIECRFSVTDIFSHAVLESQKRSHTSEDQTEAFEIS